MPHAPAKRATFTIVQQSVSVPARGVRAPHPAAHARVDARMRLSGKMLKVGNGHGYGCGNRGLPPVGRAAVVWIDLSLQRLAELPRVLAHL